MAAKAVGSLSEIAHRHRGVNRNLFPFYALPESNPSYATIKTALGLQGTEIIAINGKRGWWRKLPSKAAAYIDAEVSEAAIESWVDAIRMGEGAKLKVPAGLIEQEEAEVPPTPEEAAEPTPESTSETIVLEPVVEETKEAKEEVPHDEL